MLVLTPSSLDFLNSKRVFFYFNIALRPFRSFFVLFLEGCDVGARPVIVSFFLMTLLILFLILLLIVF